MIIKNIEFDFDFNNVDDIERFEKAYAEMQTADKTGSTTSQVCKKQIDAIKNFFENTLGEGAYQKLVEKPSNIKSNIDTLYLFVDCYEQYAKEIADYSKEKEKQYSKYIVKNRR